MNENIRDLQLDILENFKEIIEICNNNNIDYFIIGGTTLGAVRHKGFIPWDDDLDIGMTRENYNVFLKVAMNELSNNLFLQTFYSEPNTPFYFAKVRKNGTKFIEKYCKELDIYHGIYMDIFPYDNVPDNINLRNKQLRKVNLWSNLFIAKSLKGSSVPQNSIKGKFKVWIRTSFHYLLKPISKKYLYEKLDNASQEYNSVQSKIKSFTKYPSLMIASDDINNLEQIEFEGIQVNCPRNPRKQLRHQYGDFMKLPPKEERVGHRPFRLEL